MAQRVELPGLLGGIEGVVSSKDAAGLINPCFDHEGTLYVVNRIKAGVWRVVKIADDGEAGAEYSIVVDSRSVTCDCPAGRRHLNCRHKEMVRALGERRS